MSARFTERKIKPMQKAFQDLIGGDNHCHGCGPENKLGLRIKSYWDQGGKAAICRFKPQAHHCAGSPKVVNGGIIASVIDCHSVNHAMAARYKTAGREVGSEPKIWCVTAQLNISYKKPVPIDSEFEVRSVIKNVDGKKTWLDCELRSSAVVCATAEILAVVI